MLKDMVESKWVTDVSHELVFYRDENSGFGFPCDEKGNVFPLEYQAARDNLKYCLEHPEEFETWKKIETYRNEYREPAHGKCSCGREVYLWDEYCGACECECGKWYNLFGQEILPPIYWEEPIEEDY